MQLNNNYFILRHGGAISNKEGFMSSWPEKRQDPLTEKGRRQIENTIPQLKKENIDLIFSSDLLRTEQTAQIVADGLNLEINFDQRLREYNAGVFNNSSIEEWHSFFNDTKETFHKRPPGGENRRDIKERMLNFLQEIDKKYKNKNILIISHRDPLFVLESAIKGLSEEQILTPEGENLRLDTGEFKKIT
jgi:isoleucyl-tRNA synthetase